MTQIDYFTFQTNYKERRSKNHNQATIDDFINIVSTPGKTYEVLLTNPVKLFIDIDGIPPSQPKLIDEFIHTFIKFMETTFKVKITRYALTMNRGSSSHKGLSYHVYFPEYYVEKIFMIKYILLQFTMYDTEKKFFDYIDGCIYHYNRLFRCPNQYNASKDINDPMDMHNIVHGELRECIIQYIPNECKKLKIECDYSKVKGTTLKHLSFDGEKIKLKKDRKELLSKLNKLKEETEYEELEKAKKEVANKEKNELLPELILMYSRFGKNTSQINFDGLDLTDVQKTLEKLKYADKLIDGSITNLKDKSGPVPTIQPVVVPKEEKPAKFSFDKMPQNEMPELVKLMKMAHDKKEEVAIDLGDKVDLKLKNEHGNGNETHKELYLIDI